MDPNSKNQLWSKWTFKCVPGTKNPSYEDVKYNAATFGRVVFGSASQMRVQRIFLPLPDQKRLRPGWIVEVLTEGHPAHDKEYVNKMVRTWCEKFFVPGFGPGTHVDGDARVMAGDYQDGTPADQMIIIPPIPVGPLPH